jgi:hypothetical protein
MRMRGGTTSSHAWKVDASKYGWKPARTRSRELIDTRPPDTLKQGVGLAGDEPVGASGEMRLARALVQAQERERVGGALRRQDCVTRSPKRRRSTAVASMQASVATVSERERNVARTAYRQRRAPCAIVDSRRRRSHHEDRVAEWIDHAEGAGAPEFVLRRRRISTRSRHSS